MELDTEDESDDPDPLIVDQSEGGSDQQFEQKDQSPKDSEQTVGELEGNCESVDSYVDERLTNSSSGALSSSFAETQTWGDDSSMSPSSFEHLLPSSVLIDNEESEMNFLHSPPVDEDLEMYSQKVRLLPWKQKEVDGDMKTQQWCSNIEKLLSVDNVEVQTTVILMQEAEAIFTQGAVAEISRQEYPRRGSEYNSGHLQTFLRKTVNDRRSSQAETDETHKSQIMLSSCKSHFRRVLGSNRYLRIRKGIRIWAFFQTSVVLDLYKLYLLDCGEFVLAKEKFPGGGGGTREPQRAWYDIFRRGSRKSLELEGATIVRELPLEKLRIIDSSKGVTNLLKQPMLRNVGANSIAALWNDQSVEPLIIASDRQADIDDIAFVIRFVQHYKGLQLAHVNTV